MMVFMSLVPAGIVQAYVSITQGLAAARAPELLHSPLMETLVWLRVPGDIVFAIGGAFLGVYAFALLRRPRPAAVPATGTVQPT